MTFVGSWFSQIDVLKRMLDKRVTILGGPPNTIVPLPDALGGDRTRRPALEAATAKSMGSFLELAEAKAHYLMLPEPIFQFLKAMGSRVSLSEALTPGSLAGTSEQSFPRHAAIYIAGVHAGLAKTGCNFGRKVLAEVDTLEPLASIYHEMTHAWLWLQEFADAGIQKLYADGLAAYADARIEKDEKIDDPHKAFTEAAAYYVDDRIRRWCTALQTLDRWIRNPQDLAARQAALKTMVAQYNAEVTTYGIVYIGDTGHKIKSPELSASLRTAINAKVLDGRPCSKPFDETPLVALRDAILAL